MYCSCALQNCSKLGARLRYLHSLEPFDLFLTLGKYVPKLLIWVLQLLLIMFYPLVFFTKSCLKWKSDNPTPVKIEFTESLLKTFIQPKYFKFIFGHTTDLVRVFILSKFFSSRVQMRPILIIPTHLPWYEDDRNLHWDCACVFFLWYLQLYVETQLSLSFAFCWPCWIS